MHAQDLGHRRAVEGKAPLEHLIQQDPQGVEVAGRRQLQLTAALLRAHVSGRAVEFAKGGQTRVLEARGVDLTFALGDGLFADARQAKVEHLDAANGAVGQHQHDILGL